jgi:cytochrome c peroxidase
MKLRSHLLLAPAVLAALLVAAPARGQLPLSLDRVPVPEPVNLARFVKDKGAAIRLGKALFWDMQLGSDGRTACATCHFHAGTDDRTRNQLSPGFDGAFGAGARPNADVELGDFPFHRFADADDRFSAVVRSRDDVVGTQGVLKASHQQVVVGSAEDRGRPLRDGLFTHSARNVRQVTGRNAPSVINAVFNLANFWDGRANQFFNGVNPFGDLDVEARVLMSTPAGLVGVPLAASIATNPFALNNASLASQAVGPPGNEVEMSWAGRTWPEIGRKLLPLAPLAKQAVHPADSALAALRAPSGRGLATTYDAMVRAAFRDEWWNGPATAGGFAHAEANFSLFFGLAVQLYEATLVSDDTPFDRFLRGDVNALTARQRNGMNTFFSGGASCMFCHVGPELTAMTRTALLAPGEPGFIELMAMADGAQANYDIGFYNIGVRRCGDQRAVPPEPCEDLGRGGRVTLNGRSLPLAYTSQWFESAEGGGPGLPFPPVARPGCTNDPFAEPPNICPPEASAIRREAVAGAFKVPGLRNVELTGPYMHNGGMATLMQVVEFYVRGGDFHEQNVANLDPIIPGINGLKGDEQKKVELVDFLLALTDERVRQESAPFDHPQLLVPDGHELRVAGDPRRTRALADRVREIPAVGAAGRAAQGLPPVKPFLARDLEDAALGEFHFQH